MSEHGRVATALGLFLLGAGAVAHRAGAYQETPTTSLAPAAFTRAGTVDERFQSYNVEMVEVTGGNFWRPYGPEPAGQQPAATPAPGANAPGGMNPALFQYRPPIDLAYARLRRLAAALGPAYVRVSGTWANTTYFPDSDRAPKSPPAGFKGVLSRQQWKGVVDFSKAVDAEIVTSFATSAGTRDGAGVWSPEQARRLVAYTRSIGGRIAAAEFMNEPNIAAIGGAPAGYDAAAYGRDFKLFRAFVKQSAPETLVLGPGSVGEAMGDGGAASGLPGMLRTRDLLATSAPGVDAFSFHHYGATSQRCAAIGLQTTVDAALSEPWLGRTDQTLAFYRKLRDEFEPGKPFWLTETADAACGGNPWGGTFLDTFRYLDQLGRLAKQDVRVVAHNTLVASDYGLLNDQTLAPKPNYWGALLWRRLMGATVLETGVPIRAGLHTYAHCLRGRTGGVALLVINTDQEAPARLRIPTAGERYTLAASRLPDTHVQLNGTELGLGDGDDLPRLAGLPAAAGDLVFAPVTITFLALPEAGNSACR